MMAKVFAIHEIELRAGVSRDEFERLASHGSILDMTGVRNYYLRGIEGEREGKYAVLMEFESVERWKQLWPEKDTPSDELVKWYSTSERSQLIQEFGTLGAAPGSGSVYTDYEVIAGE